jgi:hypothetical protein
MQYSEQTPLAHTHARGEVLNKDDREVSAAMARHAFLLRIDELSESLLAVPFRCSISSLQR